MLLGLTWHHNPKISKFLGSSKNISEKFFSENVFSALAALVVSRKYWDYILLALLLCKPLK